MRVYILLILTLFVAVQTVPSEDQVHLSNPIYKDHRWYSGYLNFTDGAFHYVFFQSQHDPDNDPIVLWLNGGPGCSSLIGMVYENGPFVFKANTTNFELNQYSWNKKANVLYIQSPQGVGFSRGVGDSLPPLTDATVAVYNLKAMLAFYVKFPNMKKNSLYLTGQSYAGIYVPTLAYEIVKHNKLPSSKDSQILLKGFMVGNACTDPDECFTPGNGMSMYQYEFLYKHAYIAEGDYDYMVAACALGYHSQECQNRRDPLDKKFAATRTSILNIYAPCYEQNITSEKGRMRQSGRRAINESDCDDILGETLWFNEPLIQEELHVEFKEWSQCSDDVANHYIMLSNASYWLYPILMKQNLKMWVFSGDVDADVPITGTVHWLQKLRDQISLPVMEPWREWWIPGVHKHEDQVGGMVWKLKGLTFASVKGAGHMVARDKREAAYTLIDSFLYRESLPEKDTEQQ